jgi:uncharacterized protein
MAPVIFRPHHFLCALGYEGKGYSPAFTGNMTAIVIGRLRAPGGGATEIRVTGGFDDLCAPCPHNRGHACASQAKIDRLDAAHAAALGLQPGDQITWDQAQDRIVAQVPPGRLKTLCAGCEWEAYGMCEAALGRLHAERAAAGPPP